jgi:hypothetical protein
MRSEERDAPICQEPSRLSAKCCKAVYEGGYAGSGAASKAQSLPASAIPQYHPNSLLSAEKFGKKHKRKQKLTHKP